MSGTWVLIPAHNEQDTIIEMMLRCWWIRDSDNQQVDDVVVVDDGSTDFTAHFALGEHATVLTNPPGSQHGDGIRVGLRYALDHGAERIVTIDAGASYDPADIPVLLAALPGADVVVGSRVMDGAWRTQPWGRRLLTTLGTRLLGTLTDCTTLDYASFRAYTPAAARRALVLGATLDQRCHAFNPSLIFALWRDGLTIKQVPVTYTSTNSTLDLGSALGALWSLLCLWQARRWEKEAACRR